MKRMIAVALVVVCLLSLFSVTASASKGGKLIALTFDDGPSKYTATLLDGLKERGAKATFFMVGQNAAYFPETVRRVYSEGHQIAQHTYDHPTLSTKTDEQVRWQLDTTDDILNGHLGTDYNFILRPPYGDYSSHTLSILDKPAIMWSVDPMDWKYLNAETVCKNIVSAAFDGAIVLVHDIHATSIPGALAAVDKLQAQGYEFVTVNELFRRRGESLNNGELYYSCKPTGTDLGAVQQPTVLLETVYGGIRVNMKAQSGTDIYYTTDGRDPSLYGTLYTGSFLVGAGMTLKAVAAYNLNGSRSETLTKRIDGLAAKEPTITVGGGRVIIDNPNENTDVRFTTDGSEPSASSPIYTSPIACYDGILRYCVMGEGIATAVQSIYVTKNGNLFRDVAHTQWYFKNVDRAVALGLFNGVGNNCFEPETELSRSMFITVIYRLMQQTGDEITAADCDFSDVPREQWYAEAVAWGVAANVVEGYEDGTFRPDQSITREEMCAMMDRAITWLGDAQTAALSYADADRISDWAVESVRRMTALGMMQGDEKNCFCPTDTATRAEAATVLLRMYDSLE